MEDGYVFYKEQMLQNMRETTKHERHLKREKIINKRRGILGDFSTRPEAFIKTEEVTSIADRIKHKGRVTGADINRLTSAFIQNEDNINHFLNKTGALHALVRELTGTNPLTRIAATECLINLSLGNDKCCYKLAKAATPYLITNLHGMCPNLQVASIWALANLSGSDLKTWNLLNSQGLLPLLLKLFPVDEYMVIYALLHFMNTGFNEISSVDMTSVALSVTKLDKYTSDSMWLLFLLSCSDSIVSNSDLSLRFANICFDTLNGSTEHDIRMLTALIRILANLVSEVSGCLAGFVIERLDLIFSKIMGTTGHLHLFGELCWLIGNLVNHPLPLVVQQLQSYSESISELESRFQAVEG